MRRALLVFAGFAALTCAGASAFADPPRPPLPDIPPAPTLPWKAQVELGSYLAFVSRTVNTTEELPIVRYEPTLGFGLQGSFEIFRYLRFSAYFVDARHDVVLPPGSLCVENDSAGVCQGRTLEIEPMYTFAFGARFLPTLPLTRRLRVWAALGVGYGRMEFNRMKVTEPNPLNPQQPNQYIVRDRSVAFIEFPLGGGASFEVIKDWMRINLEITGAFINNQDGTATSNVQAVDATGKKRAIGGFPQLAGSFVQTLGVSLVL
jgi:hypothetical protein